MGTEDYQAKVLSFATILMLALPAMFICMKNHTGKEIRNYIVIERKKIMLKNFMSYFHETKPIVYSDDLFDDFLVQLGGKMFGGGIFNSFSYLNIKQWEEIVSKAYPDLENQFNPFGYDWLGRCFSLDLRKETAGNVLMFEIGTNDVLEIPCSFKDFLNQEIPLYTEECLAKSFFDEWKEFSNVELKYGRCAGYKVPLFLGGDDDVSNLEDSDMEVYWEIMTQIAAQI